MYKFARWNNFKYYIAIWGAEYIYIFLSALYRIRSLMTYCLVMWLCV